MRKNTNLEEDDIDNRLKNEINQRIVISNLGFKYFPIDKNWVNLDNKDRMIIGSFGGECKKIPLTKQELNKYKDY